MNLLMWKWNFSILSCLINYFCSRQPIFFILYNCMFIVTIKTINVKTRNMLPCLSDLERENLWNGPVRSITFSPLSQSSWNFYTLFITAIYEWQVWRPALFDLLILPQCPWKFKKNCLDLLKNLFPVIPRFKQLLSTMLIGTKLMLGSLTVMTFDLVAVTLKILGYSYIFYCFFYFCTKFVIIYFSSNFWLQLNINICFKSICYCWSYTVM